MNSLTNSFHSAMRKLGSPAELISDKSLSVDEDTLSDSSAKSTGAVLSGDRLRANTHIHLPPNFSAFASTLQAVDMAASEGMFVLGASNYYDYGVYSNFAALAGERGIFPLFGIEIITLIDSLVQAGIKINDPGNPGKMYICGKGIAKFDPMTNQAIELLQVIRHSDSERMKSITAKLRTVFAEGGFETGLTAEIIRAQMSSRLGCNIESIYLQERHIAQAFQEALFENYLIEDRLSLLDRVFGTPAKAAPDNAARIQDEIRSHLMKSGKPAYVQDTFVDFDHAYQLILALGGIPCYPTLADGAASFCGFEENLDTLIADIHKRGISCAEFIPVRNSPEVLTKYVRAMRDAGLFITAGTEHNTLDLIPIEPTCASGEPISGDIKEIFWEGACVVAAHQYLSFLGLPGFVDETGKPNPAYSSPNERISAFRKLGEAVITRFRLNQTGARSEQS